jgi:tetratricopeptide (TPR) repeat protein
MASPFAVILPPLFVLFDYCREKELSPICGLRKHGLALIPIVIAAVVMYAMIYKGLFGGGGGPGLRDAHVSGKAHWTVMTMMRVIFDYGMNFSCPLWLNCKYPNKMEQSLANPKIIIAMLGVLALAIMVVRQALKGNKLPLFCSGWMLICWGPVSNIVPISTTMADRYMYLPSVGLFLALVLSMNALVEREKLPAKAGIAILATLAVIFCAFTIHRNLSWRSSLDLWANSTARHPENPVAQNNMGNALRDAGFPEKAYPHFVRSLEIFEPHAEAHQSLGSYHLKKDEFAPAEKHLSRALELNPDYSEALNNLAILYAKTRVFDKAIGMFERSIELNDQRPGVWRNLAKAAAGAEQFQKSADAYLRGSQQDGDIIGYLEAGILYGGKLGDHAKAIEIFQTILVAEPGNIKARRNMGVSLANLKRYPEAEEAFLEVLKAVPDDPGALRFLKLVRAR